MSNPRRNLARAASLASALVLSLALGLPVSANDQLEFNLRTTEGGAISSEMLRGDIVVLAFGASWLKLSRAQAQGIQEIADIYGPRDVRVYWVSTDSESPKSKNYATDEGLREFAKSNGLKVAVLRDPDGAFFKRLSVQGNQLPAVVILDRSGNLHGAPIGGIDLKPGKFVELLTIRLDDALRQ